MGAARPRGKGMLWGSERAGSEKKKRVGSGRTTVLPLADSGEEQHPGKFTTYGAPGRTKGGGRGKKKDLSELPSGGGNG